jgi:hypothetical protein
VKCADCGTKARRRDLHGGRCRACGRAYAFDPSRDPYPVDDADFRAAVEKVSANGSVFFTARQLWYALHRQLSRRKYGSAEMLYVPAGGAGAAALGVLEVVPVGLLPLLGIGIGAGYALRRIHGSVADRRADERMRRPPAIPFELLRDRYLARWAEVHGPLERLLPEPAPDDAPREVPADVAAFSFDRVVVTQHADIAAMLVANRVHFENACAVLSLDGWPFGTAKTVKEMLRRNPRVAVFALHDASPEGLDALHRLRDREWFPDPATLIVDVALFSRWAGSPALRGAPARLPEPLRRTLPAGDARWYEAGNRVELATLTPATIQWELQRAFGLAGLPGEPARDESVRAAALAGGVIASTLLPISSSGDTSSTDGFG